MKKKLLEIRPMLFVLFVIGSSYAEESEAPSAEFLEFLVEFGGIEDDDYEVLVFHALNDAENNVVNHEQTEEEVKYEVEY